MSLPKHSAVLLLAHGTPDALDEIPEYLLKVTGGRPLPPEAVEEIGHRYGLIGVSEHVIPNEVSPLTRWTLHNAVQVKQRLGVPVYAGMRNWRPFIADTMRKMRADGIRQCVAICLAPQNSRTSVGLYRKAVMAAAEGIEVEFVAGWADHPMLIEAFAQRLRPALAEAREAAGAEVPVLFTAHSVPARTVQPAQDAPGDPYEAEARNTAALVAAEVGLGAGAWRFAFQSQGMSGGPWLGPTVEETLAVIRAEGHTHVLLQPVGFLCDHVEILYDIDIAFAETAKALGLKLTRAKSLNASPLLADALADLARQGFARADFAQATSPVEDAPAHPE
jgi:ferrochelatase